jgi:hypothetical protein
MQKEPKGQKHHYIPVFYLKQWIGHKNSVSRLGLTRVWSVVGALLALYAVGTWVILQGGKSFAEIPGLDGRAPVVSAYEGVVIIGTLLGLLSGVGILHMRSRRADEALLPIVGIGDVGPHDMRSGAMHLYQAFFFVVFLLIPAIALYQLNAAVLQRGIFWHDSDAALAGIASRNAFAWTRGTANQDVGEYACRKEVMRDDGFVWLANMRCDLAKASRLKPFVSAGKSLVEDAESRSPSCASELAKARSKFEKCESATDISEICEASERRCRGMQWLPVLSPLLQVVATMFGWVMFVWLVVEVCYRSFTKRARPIDDSAY